MRIFWIIYVLVAILFSLSPGHCQVNPGNYALKHFTTDNGLPQNSIKAIAFDKAGYCWLATEMGLVRYDGRTFNVFGTANLQGITTDRMQFLQRNARGDVYAMTASVELLETYHPADGHAPVPRRTRTEVLSGKHGLAIDNPAVVAQFKKVIPHYPTSRFPDYFGIPDGSAYMYNHDSLFLVSPRHAKPEKLFSYLKTPESIPLNLLPFSDHRLVQIAGHGACLWQEGKFVGQLALPQQITTARQTKFFVDGTTVYLVIDRQLFQLSLGGNKLNAHLLLEGLPADDISCVTRHQDRYYLGTYTKGLFEISVPQFSYPIMPAGLESENFYAQAKFNDSLVFVRDVLLPVGKLGARMLATRTESSCAYLVDGSSFYLEEDYRLKKYDTRSGSSRLIATLDNRLRYIGRTQSEQILFATTKFVGKLTSDSITSLRRFPDKLIINQMTPLGSSRYLLCTQSGLKWYDAASNKIYFQVLDSIPVRTVLAEKPDRVWIASYGRGAYLLDKGRLYRFPLGPFQALKTVHAFIDDSAGNFWLPTNNGLFYVKKQSLIDALSTGKTSPYFFRLSRQQGLRTNEFNGGCDPAFVWLKDSLLSLPSLDGLVWFYPLKLQPDLPKGRIYLNEITVNEKPIESGSALTLPPDFSAVSISISSPYFGSSENLSFEYQLTGLTSWLPMPQSGILTLNGLPAGDHQVRFRKAAGLYRLAPENLVISLTVHPWFYQTVWFWGLLIAGAMASAWLFWRRRLKALEAQAMALEAQVAARTSELSIAVEDLARSELALSRSNHAKDKVITMVLHDLRSPIHFITQISSYIADHHNRMGKQDLAEKLAELKLGSTALEIFTKDFFMWAVSQKEGFGVTISNFSVSDLFDELKRLYGEILQSRQNVLLVDSRSVIVCSDYQILSFILRNLIDNANKNTLGGRVMLNALESSEHISIWVTDTGKGLTTEQINAFYDENRPMDTRGAGSLMIMDMARLIGAGLEIHSQPGQGSTFILKIPTRGQRQTAQPAVPTA